MKNLEIESFRKKLIKSLTIIQNYDYLINAYALDFFVENHWDKLPTSWQSSLHNFKLENLSYLLAWEDDNTNNKHLWPLSLLTLRTLFRDLCIKRQKTNNEIELPTLLKHPKLKHIFAKGVKLKKSHELKYMANICKESFMQMPVDFIVDFGSGLGHLARLLGYCYGIQMCCLEQQANLNKQAENIDAHLEELIKKYTTTYKDSKYKTPVHLNIRLTHDMTANDFLNTVQNAMNLQNNNFTFGIVGLHPCGDLAVILIRLFLNCQQAKFLNLVSCCYMKLSTNNNTANNKDNQLYSYPLSQYIRKQIRFKNLSYEAREIACHAMELYRERLENKDYNHLKIHSFRAAAEYVIVQYFPHFKHMGLRNTKYFESMDFKDYFHKAVNDLLPVATLSEFQLCTPAIYKYLSEWPRVVIFYTLRLFFAPLIESVLLYDRLLYLMENDCQVEAKAIFEGRISPRNHVISAMKSL